MIFLTQRPCAELREFVDWYWYFAGLSPVHRLERVLPDGSCELVINLREEPRHVYGQEDHSPVAAYRGAWLSGAHSRFIVIDTAADSSMMGVHFKPGGVAAVLGASAGDIADSVVEVDAVWGRRALRLREALLDEREPVGKFAMLESFLVSLARRVRPGFAGIQYAVRYLMKAAGPVGMESLARDVGMSHKHFIARFRDAVGLTPKRFFRVRRFQQVLCAIEAGRRLEWTTLAGETGYYDQAHFIRDFREFSGLSPSAYLAQRGEYLNFVPV